VIDDRYRLVALLGKGGMGEVYRAQDLKLGQPVALKFLPEELERDAVRLSRFLEEVRLSRQVSHPNVCRVHDVREVEGHHFLSMEFVDGEDLGSLLRRIGRLPEDKALQIARQLCAGVAAAHREGILHRDLKPANIMIDGRGHVRITDFGLAGMAEQIEGAEVRAGTPAYMAPEQVAGKEVTVKSDLYSLGLVLYELFTGKPAYRASNLTELLKAFETPPTSPSSVLEIIDPAVERVILRCLEKAPEKRPESAVSVAAALPGGDPLGEALAAGDTPSPEMVAASGEEGGLSPGVAVTCLVVFLLGVLGANLILQQGSLTERVNLVKQPEVLEVEAKELLTGLGYEVSTNSAYRFDVDEDQLEYIEESDSSVERWESLKSISPGPIFYWYRQSPRALVPANGVGPVGENDPPAYLSGMVFVRLDPQGRLLEFRAVPPEFDESEKAGTVDWSPLFEKAGLDRALFNPAQPSWNPLVDCDERAAWVGHYPEQEDVEIRAEAGSYRGQVVYFRVVTPWTKPTRMEESETTASTRIAQIIGLSLFVLVFVGGAILARRNLRKGRGDARGALRLAIYVFVLSFLNWVLGIDHVAAGEELLLLFWSVSASLFFFAVVWVAYVALEPYVRRIWPETLVSWSRLMAGHFKDPLVGRDILFGGIAGVLVALLVGLSQLTPAWFGQPVPEPNSPLMDTFTGIRQAFSWLFLLQFNAVTSPLTVMLVILIARILLRRQWLAVAVAYVLFSAVGILSQTVYLWAIPFFILVWVVLIVMITRFGLLPAILTFYFANILLVFTAPSDLSIWYAPRFIFIQLLMVGVVVYGFSRALKGQTLLGEDII
jgi:serine/threonine-protein kinase